MSNTAQEILDAVGGPGNISHFTHCATRLRFELNDASVVDKDRVEAIDGVLGAVPQSGDRYQIVIGGAVQSVFNEINNLPSMKSGGAASNDDVKAAARAKARGKNAIVDAFFEYLSDSFRPLLPVLLGASLILALLAVLDALHIVDTRAETIPAWLGYVNSMWRAVFYFLPAMVAYNASKKLDIDPWVGTAVILSLLTPNFIGLSNASSFSETTCEQTALGTEQCVSQIASLEPLLSAFPILNKIDFWLPLIGRVTFPHSISLQLADYGGQVFVPLLMVPILALVYKGLKKIVPANVQMVFVPFISFMIIMPLTAFLIGPLSIWIGNGLGGGLAWLNGHAPIVFSIIIPIIYPFLVPLGLHWPLNALQLANIASTGSDFIQGPMGAWNFACFGATAGVLFLSIRDRDTDMRQTASGALAAGLFGGISEPSLYGIHLRFKRIYPLMLTGCVAGGLVIGIGGGAITHTFVFTSLLTIPVFSPMAVYGLGIAAAFFTAFLMVVFFDYRTKEQKAEAREKKAALKAGVSAAPAAPAPAAAAEGAPAPAAAPEVSDEAKKYETELQKDRMNKQLQQYGLTLESYLQMTSMTQENYDQQMQAAGENVAKVKLMVDAIAKKEKLKLNDEAYKALEDSYGYSKEMLVSILGKEQVDLQARELQVANFILDKATKVPAGADDTQAASAGESAGETAASEAAGETQASETAAETQASEGSVAAESTTQP